MTLAGDAPTPVTSLTPTPAADRVTGRAAGPALTPAIQPTTAPSAGSWSGPARHRGHPVPAPVVRGLGWPHMSQDELGAEDEPTTVNGLGWPTLVSRGTTASGDGSVSRGTDARPQAEPTSAAEPAAVGPERAGSDPSPFVRPAEGAFRTAGDLTDLGVVADESTPLARSVEQSLLVRGGRRKADPLPRPPRTRVMVVANQKGGVGKTTTAVNLAAALAQGGLRVLVIDLDPQGNASTALAVDHHRGTASVYDAVVEGVPLVDIVAPSPEIDGLFVVPATIDLAGAEIELVSLVAREGRLRRAIRGHPQVSGDGADRFDYVLIDCPPSLGLLTLNALVAGDEMLIPIQAEYYALEGLGQLLETVEMVRSHLNPDLTVSTIVLTMYDARTRLSAGVADEVRTHFAGQVLRTAIPRSVRISEAPSYGQTVMTYDPASPGALSYLEAAREIASAAPQSRGPEPMSRVDEGARR